MTLELDPYPTLVHGARELTVKIGIQELPQ
jgi:hypothetical protein